MFHRTGARFRNCFRKTNSPALRNKYAIKAGAFRCAQHRAEIVRIFDAVEDDEQRRVLPTSD